MSNTNEILKSLAVLEHNLENIQSAKEQVAKVVESSGKLAQVIESYKSSFEGLASSVQTVLKESKSFSIETITKLSEETNSFRAEVKKLIEFNFIGSFKSIEQEVVKVFEQDLLTRLVVFDNKVKDFQSKINELQAQISHLVEFDFEKKFQILQNRVVEQFEKNLSEKLVVIDSKSQNLQDKIDDMQKQIVRFESIDLEAHFAKHQKTLSEIFTATTAINITLTNITQSLTSITQGLGVISLSIESCKAEIIDKLGTVSNVIDTCKNEIISNQNDFENELNTRLNDIESAFINKISEIENHNLKLSKGVKLNRLILLSGMIIIIGLMVFSIFAK